MVTSHNKFGEFTQEELIYIRSGLLSTSTYGYENDTHSGLYKEADRAWDELEFKRLEALPKCGACGKVI